MIRQVSAVDAVRGLENAHRRAQAVLLTHRIYQMFIRSGHFIKRKLILDFKEHSSKALKAWAHQCECVAAQRLRRGQQMFCLYSRLWEEAAFREFLRGMRFRLTFKNKELVFGALGLMAYDWRSNRISDEDMKSHINDLDYICVLREKTLCQSCKAKELDPSCNSRVCHCEDFDPAKKYTASYDDWMLFIEKNDLIVWRRKHRSGAFEYKVYGSYKDVSAEDFLNVQVDIQYRRQWDNTAVEMNVIEKDPDPTSNSDIIYWELLWPRLFSNRDYVFNRRYMVEYNSKTVLLVNKTTEHPKHPKTSSKFRVTDYWSYMVIKPYTELNRPGIEFSLTYFDNPGVNIPASVTAWVAMRAMPEYLERLREATKKYKVYCKQAGVKCVCNIMDEQLSGQDLELLEDRSRQKWQLCCNFDDLITDNTIFEAQYTIQEIPTDSGSKTTPSKDPPRKAENSTNENNITPNTENGSSNASSPVQEDIKNSTNRSIWRFFRPTYYFS